MKKGLDFFLESEYSINCSAVEPHGEAGTERVPCKLNNECKTKHQSSASEMALKEKPKDRVESITCHGGSHREMAKMKL